MINAERTMNRQATMISVVAVAAIVLLATVGCSSTPEPTDDEVVDAESQADIPDSQQLPVGDSAILGDPEAPVTVMEFSSMQCPFCARSAETLEELVDHYDGQVRVVFKHFPLPFQQQAEPASRLLVAAQRQDEDAFWEMKSALFEHLEDYEKGNMGRLGAELSEQLGLDTGQLLEDFHDPEVARLVEEDKQLGQNLGVRGTPHFFVNGEVLNGAKPFEVFANVVDAQLELVDRLAAEGVDDDELYAAAVEKNLDEQPPQPDSEPEPQRGPSDVEAVEIDDDAPAKGASEDEALVTIVEFSSFQCPFCASVAPTLDELVERYPDEVRVVFNHFPLAMQDQSEPAARAAVAADEQGKFWEMRDAIYDAQSRLGTEGIYEELAEQLGLDLEQFNEDFHASGTQAIIDESKKRGRAVGVRGTPAFFVNGVSKTGAQPLESFAGRVEQQIEIAEKVREETGLSGDELHDAVVEHNQDHAEELVDMPEAGFDDGPEADSDDGAELDAGDVEVESIDPDELTVDDSYTRGPDDAAVTIYKFSSFQCPFSRANAIIDDIVAEYGDDVRLVYKNHPLPNQAESEPAARAALAAGEQGKFWEMHHALYDNQRRLAEPGLFEELARELGLDLEQFHDDFKRDAIAEQVQDERRQGQAAGVRGVPHFFINGEELKGAKPVSEFQKVIDDQLQEE